MTTPLISLTRPAFARSLCCSSGMALLERCLRLDASGADAPAHGGESSQERVRLTLPWLRRALHPSGHTGRVVEASDERRDAIGLGDQPSGGANVPCVSAEYGAQ